MHGHCFHSTSYRAFMAAVKVHVAAVNSYPEVLVTCSEADRASRFIKRSAAVDDATEDRPAAS